MPDTRPYEARLESVRNQIFRGTTCGHFVEKVQRFGRYAYIKKRGHTSYVGRFTEPVWCGTIHVLLDLDNLPKHLGYHDSIRKDPLTLLYREGRLTKADKELINQHKEIQYGETSTE